MNKGEKSLLCHPGSELRLLIRGLLIERKEGRRQHMGWKTKRSCIYLVPGVIPPCKVQGQTVLRYSCLCSIDIGCASCWDILVFYLAGRYVYHLVHDRKCFI